MKDKCCCSGTSKAFPRRFDVTAIDHIKVLFNWLFLFNKPFIVRPGLYYTGERYDNGSPLIVTCNFLSTVVLLKRSLRPLNARLLVIDTKGINVWCSAGKGQFSSKEILDKLNTHKDIIFDGERPVELILPKLSLSGVRLSELKKDKRIHPVIGPVYAKDLKGYLEHSPYKDCADDRVIFGIKQRFYTLIPTVVQFSGYALLMGCAAFLLNLIFKTGFRWQIVPVSIAIAALYPLLFPYLPGKRFAVKGLSLAAAVSLATLFAIKGTSYPLGAFYVSFIFATSVLLALSYTGNSPVSNYSKIRKEIAHFLPLSIFLYIVSIIFYFISRGGA